MGPGAVVHEGGKLNLSHNCVDRHANGARRDKVALLWEGEPGDRFAERRITRRPNDRAAECRASQALSARLPVNAGAGEDDDARRTMSSIRSLRLKGAATGLPNAHTMTTYESAAPANRNCGTWLG